MILIHLVFVFTIYYNLDNVFLFYYHHNHSYYKAIFHTIVEIVILFSYFFTHHHCGYGDNRLKGLIECPVQSFMLSYCWKYSQNFEISSESNLDHSTHQLIQTFNYTNLTSLQ